jgi:hypothetical protein
MLISEGEETGREAVVIESWHYIHKARREEGEEG